MNVLIVYAHPEPRSLNGALKDFAVRRLEQAGHTVQVSDLYAMRWKAAFDRDDATALPAGTRFDAMEHSREAFEGGTQAADIEQEQHKLRWADAVILQFPLWWFSMPAILKGWIDRVYAFGFAYGVGEHSESRWGERYGEGTLAGKRAMLVVTMGGWESHYAPRGINGAIDEVLFYPGFSVLPPHLVYRTGKIDEANGAAVHEALGRRLDTLWQTEPIPFRRQNGGDYRIPELTLRPELAPGETGLRVHVAGD